MKQLIIINGPAGIGKTTVSKKLYQSLERSVWLDGDWCWMMNPWVITEENKKMVESNIVYLLRNYLSNSTFDYIIFNWVLHREEIMQRLLNSISDFEFRLTPITLTCSAEALRERMLLDHRTDDQIETSCYRQRLYEEMETYKIDTTKMNVDETIMEIMEQIYS
ncbi:AAA family ATPase [Paenibacillus senegalimassiliensis]|uniref:AAA family ATPase n=1 Tax=Paenibacillus senegalimassiliensis TaxID=1737426 RepID=UPI00073ED218|nr:AAA family ATPase [Paenibacillus senegalimassiliensis]